MTRTALKAGTIAGLFALALPALAGADPIVPERAPWPGPPWISIEVPPNPHDRETRDAFLVVHTYHHGRDAAFEVKGKAEGLVNGERRSLELELRRTARPGVYALDKQWPGEGAWVLVISTAGSGEASALVELGMDGSVASVTVPTYRQGQWTIPRAVTAQEIAAALDRRAAQLAAAPSRG